MHNFGNVSKDGGTTRGVARPTLYDLLNKYGLSAEAYSKANARNGTVVTGGRVRLNAGR